MPTRLIWKDLQYPADHSSHAVLLDGLLHLEIQAAVKSLTKPGYRASVKLFGYHSNLLLLKRQEFKDLNHAKEKAEEAYFRLIGMAPAILAEEIYQMLYDETESFGAQGVAGNGLYLMGAILKGHKIDLTKRQELYKLLFKKLPCFHPVWQHINVIDKK